MTINPVNLKGLFKSNYQLKGRDWVKTIPPEDREVLIHAFQAAGEFGRLGGRARAIRALRDAKGRFI